MRRSTSCGMAYWAAVLITAGCGHEGLNFTYGGVPPDTQYAVGNGPAPWGMEATNGEIGFFEFNTGTDTHASPDTILHSTCAGQARLTDPILQYDSSTDRWFFLMVLGNRTIGGLKYNGGWCCSVSQTSNPKGAWNKWYFKTTFDWTYDGVARKTFPDYPRMAITSDKVVITGNPAHWSDPGDPDTSYADGATASNILIVNKADLLNGVANPSRKELKSTAGSEFVFSLVPVHHPQGDIVSGQAFLVGLAASFTASPASVRRIYCTGNGGNSNCFETNYTSPYGQATPGKSALQPVASPRCPTPTSCCLDPVADFTMDATWSATENRIYAVQTGSCIPSGDTVLRSCIRAVRIPTSGTSMIANDDKVFALAGLDVFMPAIIGDRFSNVLMVFNTSSASQYADIRGTGRRPTDAVGTWRTPTVLRSGNATYDCEAEGSPDPYETCLGLARWGDYSSASLVARPRNGLVNADSLLGGEYALAPVNPGDCGQYGTYSVYTDSSSYPP